MPLNRSLSYAVLTALLALFTAAPTFSQGTLRRGTVETDTKDSEGHLKLDSTTKQGALLHGSVLLPNDAPPEQVTEIVAACPTFQRIMAIADSKGKFSFTFNPNMQSDADLTKGCSLYASLEGYRSDTINLSDLTAKSNRNLGEINLQPIAADSSGLTSSTEGNAGSAQRKLYEKAFDKAAKADWKGAIVDLQQATSASPGYASAWFALGVCQQSIGILVEAEKSFLTSAQADPKFALPLVRAAALEEAAGNMDAAFSNSQKAIDLNRNAFPDAYALNAIASLSTKNAESAEKSARNGLALDKAHQYSELEYALGVVLYAKGDQASATDHLQKYLAQSPNGPNVATARNQLAQMNETSKSAAQLATSTANQQAGPTAKAIESAPTTSSLQNHNAPLLANPSAYSCLETILPAKVDQRGRATELETLRADVAVSGGKEIYGSPNGKRFADNAEREWLGYNFATTGLFDSIARALIVADPFAIEPAGEVVANGETLVRYNFRSLPNTAGWRITYGNETGVAGEQGWFLVERKSQILRRVLVAATNIPSNLKLIGLTAVIDYEPETLAGHRVLLPTLARVEVTERSGGKHMSLLSFDHCRTFTAESTISFDQSDKAGEPDKPLNPPRLPINAEILVSLNSALSLTKAEESDLVTASVVKPVIEKGRELIPAGAAVEGRSRLKRGQNSVIIELDRVQTSSGWVPFYARLLRVASEQVQIQRSEMDAKSHLAFVIASDQADLTQPDIPGVATLTFLTKESELPAGTQMVWQTESLFVPRKDVASPQLGTPMSMH